MSTLVGNLNARYYLVTSGVLNIATRAVATCRHAGMRAITMLSNLDLRGVYIRFCIVDSKRADISG